MHGRCVLDRNQYIGKYNMYYFVSGGDPNIVSFSLYCRIALMLASLLENDVTKDLFTVCLWSESYDVTGFNNGY